jgi:hypothetical protein
MEKLLGRKLEAGMGNAKCLRLTLDKVDMLHQSLMQYLVSFYKKMQADSSFYSTS